MRLRRFVRQEARETLEKRTGEPTGVQVAVKEKRPAWGRDASPCGRPARIKKELQTSLTRTP